MRATMQQVAALAGVSSTTVSHVLNRSRPVQDDTRRAVEAAAAELRYVPSAVGRALRRRSTRTVGLLVTDSSDPFFAEAAQALEAWYSERGYAVILCNSYGEETRWERQLAALLGRRVDGLVVTPVGDPRRAAARLAEAGVPVVLFDRPLPGLGADSVGVQNEWGALLAVRHLGSLGHRAIGCLAGPLDGASVFPLRVAGYRRGLQELGVRAPDAWVAEAGDSSMEAGYEAAERLLGANPGLTALFAANDFLAVGALRCARARGLAVPARLSLVGFDAVDVGRYLRPALTSVTQPIARLAQVAAERLLARIRDGDAGGGGIGRCFLLEPGLTVRESTGPAPKAF